MLKWWTGGRGARSAAGTARTDDPLASIADRTPRKHEPVYSVIRVNPLFREGPTLTHATAEDQPPSSAEFSLPGSERETEQRSLTERAPTLGRRPGVAQTDSGHCSLGRMQSAGEVVITQPLFRNENETDLPSSRAEILSSVSRNGVRSAALRKARRPLQNGYEWVGFDVLVMNGDYVASLAVNLAKTGGAGIDLSAAKHLARVENVTMPHALTPTIMKNPEFVRHVQVTTGTERPTVCPRLRFNKNEEFVSISAPCVHANTKNIPVSFSPVVRRIETCPKVTVDANANYIVNISSLCSHVASLSGGTKDNIFLQPNFHIGSSTHQDVISEASQTAASDPLSSTAPDSLVTDSLLAMISSDLSPDLTRDRPPSSGSSAFEDRCTPERVLRELSHIIVSSRSVSAVRRVSSDVRSSSASSRSSVTSQVSRASSCRQLTAPGAAKLWQRTGLVTNGRKLLLAGEEAPPEESEETEARNPVGVRRLTPSPPVPARLPVSGGWLQRLTEISVRSAAADADPHSLTDVVVEPASGTSDRLQPDCGCGSARRVTFSLSPHTGDVTSPPLDTRPGLAGLPSVMSPWLISAAGDEQSLWNSYYGGAVPGYGPLQPNPHTLANNQKASALNDRKFSEFTLDVTGSTRLRQRAVKKKRMKRLCRIIVVAIVLISLLGGTVLVSWICSKGRHLFGAL